MNSEEQFALMQRISESFSPSAPIDQKVLFAGRIQQFTDVANAVAQRGQHVILFGERGVGKTSLSTVISHAFKGTANTISSGTINCDQTMDFGGLWRKVFREIPINAGITNGIGFNATPTMHTGSLADYLPATVTPDDIRHILQRLGKTIIVIDELDRIEDPEVTTLLADTIKTLSDHSVPTTLILVGVADSVNSLIQEHQSVERALVQIRMPRMTVAELDEIIDKGVANAGMTIEKAAKNKISSLSQGLPHYTHLLALHALQTAARKGQTHVTGEDVSSAIENALSKAQQSIISAYHKATSSQRENLYAQVLLACALAKPDALGYFSAADVRDPMTEIMGRFYDIPAFSQHLNAFCDDQRGPILQRIGETRRFRFRFINPLMQPYVTMDGLKRGLIKDTSLLK
ncbi:AAA family ATPase [Duganella sp. CF517]|uniref:nSTAND1 domain-containing NTPase n=1 Tax=Duganella sp. CF517 TaxID=1881038 RepID=UPI0015A6DD24|nr:AAA family ATPase [Duganella sp. CF517]